MVRRERLDRTGRLLRQRLAVRLRALGVAVLILLGACAEDAPPPRVIRVSAVPDRTPEQVKAQHAPTLDVVCAAAGVRCEWVAVATYPALVDALGRGEIDLAFLGGVTYVRAKTQYGAESLVVRDIDMRFSSTIVVRTDAKAWALHELAGAAFAFGNRSSTSGHVMPRHFLAREAIDAETFFSRVEYAENHDAALAMVATGKADAGVANSAIALRALAAGGRYHGILRAVWESPSYADYVWAVRPHIARDVRQRLLNAFLDMNVQIPQHADALRAEGARGFLPAVEREYDAIARAMRTAGVH